MFVRDLEMGPVGLKDLAIVFADAHVFKQLKLENKPALLLGMNAMRAFKKVFDRLCREAAAPRRARAQRTGRANGGRTPSATADQRDQQQADDPSD